MVMESNSQTTFRRRKRTTSKYSIWLFFLEDFSRRNPSIFVTFSPSLLEEPCSGGKKKSEESEVPFYAVAKAGISPSARRRIKSLADGSGYRFSSALKFAGRVLPGGYWKS